MESTDLVIVLVVVAIGAFAGGILFGMWLMRKIERPTSFGTVISTDIKRVRVKPLSEAHVDPNTIPLSGKYQPTAHSRIGLSNLIRQMEEDDPEAKRHEQIMKANGGN